MTLTQRAYRVYASALAEWLKNEVEEKKILPPGQMGFKKGMRAINNIYLLNYVINRRILVEEGKMIMFID